MKPQDYWVRNECGSDRISLTEACAQPRLPIFGVLDNIRSAHNVGSMFRTADGANIGELLICGYSPTPPHKHLSKTALGAVDVVPWHHCETLPEPSRICARGMCKCSQWSSQTTAHRCTTSHCSFPSRW
jgi:tRNA G18 (ribose-2'-O)-methylase SpoU